MSEKPLITVAVPSYNQGRFLEQALSSIAMQNVPHEIFVMDGGSNDNSLDIIKKWQDKIAGFRSHKDNGQSAAINEAIAKGSAPYVCWLNSDDWFLEGAFEKLLNALQNNHTSSAVYGRAWNVREKDNNKTPIWVEPFSRNRLALRCIISQPATLIRRSAWEEVAGLNASLHMAMDYDLWWRLFKAAGPLTMVDEFVAVNREHDETKTNTKRRLHYQEAMQIVRENHGSVPLKWWLYQPYAVWFKSWSMMIKQA
ncbi:MAG: glycosyl transferase [Legionellales bacterium RIFCSPHIGHO2_12_FULL_35_11]|nr:MAG: glycosyl transferase [Legionellales bacterium RIFCSPHIGHO2_12_FULL_35_11]